MGNEKLQWLIKRPIAHRGLFNSDYPENSLSAFDNAIRNNYGIELDVQFTKDKKVVVFHDDNLKRMTSDARDVNELNYKELKKLKLLDSGENIPLLTDVLQLVNSRVPIVIEIKNCKNIIELGEATYEITQKYQGEYAVESFNPNVIEWFKKNAPDVIRGQLSGDYKKFDGKMNILQRFILTNLLLNFKSKPNFVAYELDSLPNYMVSYLRNRGMIIISWTIKNIKDLEKAKIYSDNYIFDSFIPNEKQLKWKIQK